MDAIALVEKIVRGRWEAPKCKVSSSHVLLASFPKSGNTWVRFVVSNILRGYTQPSCPVDFYAINQYAPVIRGNRRLEGSVVSEVCPTFLKTHFYYNKHFAKFPSVVIYRDPFKTLLSYYKYMEGEVGRSYSNFEHFLSAPRVGVEAFKLFHTSWLSSDAILVSYEELVQNPVVGFCLIYDRLGYQIDRDSLEKALASSTREAMSKAEQSSGDPYKKSPNFQFVSNRADRYDASKYEVERDLVFTKTRKIYSELHANRLRLAEGV